MQASYSHGYEDRSPRGAKVAQEGPSQPELTLTTYSHDLSLTSRIMESFSAPDEIWIDASRASSAFVSQQTSDFCSLGPGDSYSQESLTWSPSDPSSSDGLFLLTLLTLLAPPMSSILLSLAVMKPRGHP